MARTITKAVTFTSTRTATNKKHFLSMSDLTFDQLLSLLELAAKMKKDPESYKNSLQGKSAVLIFQKPSSRTLISFATGIGQLGGVYVAPPSESIQMGTRERPRDIARTVSRYNNLIIARVFGHGILEELAEYATIPVINALSDLEHPCQALGDLLTIQECFHNFQGLKLAFIGDGNNVCHSLMIGAALVEMEMIIACPYRHDPNPEVLKRVRNRVMIEVTSNINDVRDADVIYTDVWASMGQEASRGEELTKIFQPFQVNSKLMARQKPSCIFMHCLPARLGEEVTEEVYESSASVIWPQAENRLHVQKALMTMLIG